MHEHIIRQLIERIATAEAKLSETIQRLRDVLKIATDGLQHERELNQPRLIPGNPKELDSDETIKRLRNALETAEGYLTEYGDAHGWPLAVENDSKQVRAALATGGENV